MPYSSQANKWEAIAGYNEPVDKSSASCLSSISGGMDRGDSARVASRQMENTCLFTR
jgi:hypothetical protein